MIPIYKQEIEDGIGELITKQFSLAYNCNISKMEEELKSIILRYPIPELEATKASTNDFDVEFLKCVYVSTGWNANDEVFDKIETWVARKTPTHKPFNYQHDCTQIVGHTISAVVMDDNNKVVDDNAAIEDVPTSFNILTGNIIYKYWDKPEIKETVEQLFAEIDEGKWFVSMECLFKGFDYALSSANDEVQIIARNERTAFLSKKLKAYGGNGEYNGQKIGRLIRNINFCGTGFVKNPANKKSEIILNNKVKAFLIGDFDKICATDVYTNKVNPQESDKMTLEELQAQYDSLKASYEKAKAENEAAAKLAESLQTAKAENETLVKQIAELNTSLNETKEELGKLYAEQARVERVAFAKEKLSMTSEDATEFVKSSLNLSKEAFEAQVATIAKAKEAWVTNNPQDGNTKFDSSVKPGEAKSTPAPLPPKSTPAPLPGKAKAEVEADLENVEHSEAALNVKATDSGVDSVQKQIAAYFGCEE